MKPKFWHVGSYDHRSGRIPILQKNDDGTVYTIAEVLTGGVFKRDAQETAKIMAAAPELLEALERLTNVASGQVEDSLEAAIDQAYDAIAKARSGRSYE